MIAVNMGDGLPLQYQRGNQAVELLQTECCLVDAFPRGNQFIAVAVIGILRRIYSLVEKTVDPFPTAVTDIGSL
jgi:hypothetical protein